MKPHRGYISNWKICPLPSFRGCYIVGGIHGHPVFRHWIRTSIIIAIEGDKAETLNSMYTLVGEGAGNFIPPATDLLEELQSN